MGLFGFGKKKKKHDELRVMGPRIQMVPLHNISLKLTAPFAVEEMQIVNLSATGIGIKLESFPEPPVASMHIEGLISISQLNVPFKAKIIHITGAKVGCQFIDIDEDFPLTVNKYFFRELQAIEMKEVREDFVKQDPGGTTRWFQGGDHTSLHYVYKNDSIIRFEIAFFGTIIQGGEQLPLVFGTLDETINNRMKQYQGSEIIYDPKLIENGLQESVVKFVINIKGLESHHREWLAKYISNSAH